MFVKKDFVKQNTYLQEELETIVREQEMTHEQSALKKLFGFEANEMRIESDFVECFLVLVETIHATTRVWFDAL